jgi:hypothetical protein
MNDKDLTEILESTEAPRVDLPNAKALLRRRLVAAARHPRRARRRRLRDASLIAAAAAALWAAFWLLPSGPTAAELIRDMEDVYTHDVPEGRVYYMRQLIRIQGQPPVEEERWSDDRARRVRLLHRDATTGAILGHSILDGSRVYGSKDSRLRVRRSIARIDDPGAEPRRIKTSVLVPRSGDDSPGSVIVVRDIFDPEEFARRSPSDIVTALASSANVDYAGMETSAESGRTLHVLTRRIDAVTLAIESLDEIPETVAGEIERMMQDTEPEDRSLGATERITIMADSSRIHGLTLVIDRHGEEIYRLDKIFLGQAWLEDSPTIFDPNAHGLLPIEPPEPVDTNQETP